MKVKGFITITPYDEKKRGEDRKPLGKAMINVDEIALIMSVADNGSAVCLKDYKTKIFCFDTEKDIKYKIIAARGETK
jgi:hypothetical protein